jgi:hypothetical protein
VEPAFVLVDATFVEFEPAALEVDDPRLEIVAKVEEPVAERVALLRVAFLAIPVPVPVPMMADVVVLVEVRVVLVVAVEVMFTAAFRLEVEVTNEEDVYELIGDDSGDDDDDMAEEVDVNETDADAVDPPVIENWVP